MVPIGSQSGHKHPLAQHHAQHYDEEVREIVEDEDGGQHEQHQRCGGWDLFHGGALGSGRLRILPLAGFLAIVCVGVSLLCTAVGSGRFRDRLGGFSLIGEWRFFLRVGLAILSSLATPGLTGGQ